MPGGSDLCLESILRVQPIGHNLWRDAARSSRRLEFVGQKRKDRSKTQDLQTVVGRSLFVFDFLYPVWRGG